LSASDALLDTDFSVGANYSALPALPLAHGALPTGWADNSTWSKADCTYAYTNENSTGFLRIVGAAKGRIQFLHPLPPLAERSAFRLTLRARSAGSSTVRLAIAHLTAPYRTVAATTVPLTATWQDATRVIAGGPAEGPLGVLLSTDSPGIIDLASLRIEPTALSDYTPTTTVPVMRTDRDWYPQRQRDLVAQLVAEQPRVVLMGDSLTAAWAKEGAASWSAALAPLHTTAFGIGGDRIEHLAWRIRESGIGTTFTPAVVVLLIGVNNLGTDNPEDIALGTAAVVDQLQKATPKTRILLLGLFPTGEASDHPNRAVVTDINTRYAELARSHGITFCDLGPKLLAADGRLTPQIAFDALHLTPAGYAIYARELVPAITGLLTP
jgi:beta-glucosidase